MINMTLPDKEEDYVHRVGRVGRADVMGLAISFVATKHKEKVWYVGHTMPLLSPQPPFPTASFPHSLLSPQPPLSTAPFHRSPPLSTPFPTGITTRRSGRGGRSRRVWRPRAAAASGTTSLHCCAACKLASAHRLRPSMTF